MDQYLEITVVVEQEDADSIAALMESEGAYSVTIISTDDEACFDIAEPGIPQWQKQTISGLYSTDFDAENFSRLADREVGRHLEIQQKIIKNQDWERVWLEQFKPINIGDRLRICPSWIEPKADDRINVVIDPGMAFGTGTHETTSLCLGKIAEMELENFSVLDFGCGSGILGITAGKLGAAEIVGIDIDQRAIETANRNAAINGMQGVFTAMLNEKFEAQYAGKRFNLVLANILAGTLVSLSQMISDWVTNTGYLMLSGILRDQIENVLKVYANEFEFAVFYENEWAVLVGQRKI